MLVELHAGKGGLGNLDAQRAFRQEIHLVDENLDDGAKGQCHHGQIRSCHTQCRQGQQGAKAGGDTNIAKAVAELEETIVRGGTTKEQLVDELRQSNMARSTLASALRKVVDSVKDQTIVTQNVRKVRRITPQSVTQTEE